MEKSFGCQAPTHFGQACVQDMLHWVRFEDDQEDDPVLSEEMFNERLKTLGKKCKDKYQFILKVWRRISKIFI